MKPKQFYESSEPKFGKQATSRALPVKYDSVSTIAIYKNGKGITKTQRVHIKNGKGYKEIAISGNKRGKTQKKRKALTKSELKCIQTCKFKKGLFRDCLPDCA